MYKTRLSRLTALFMLLALMASLLPTGQVIAASPSVFVNEIHYDNSGGDIGEAVEVAGPAGTDLAGWSIALYKFGRAAWRECV
jgi:hypothetical protein